MNVTLAGSGNQASGGFLSTFNLGGDSLFTENITPAQMSFIDQAVQAGVSLTNFQLNVNATGGNNVLVGGLMGNFTTTGGGNNRFVIEDPAARRPARHHRAGAAHPIQRGHFHGFRR